MSTSSETISSMESTVSTSTAERASKINSRLFTPPFGKDVQWIAGPSGKSGIRITLEYSVAIKIQEISTCPQCETITIFKWKDGDEHPVGVPFVKNFKLEVAASYYLEVYFPSRYTREFLTSMCRVLLEVQEEPDGGLISATLCPCHDIHVTHGSLLGLSGLIPGKTVTFTFGEFYRLEVPVNSGGFAYLGKTYPVNVECLWSPLKISCSDGFPESTVLLRSDRTSNLPVMLINGQMVKIDRGVFQKIDDIPTSFLTSFPADYWNIYSLPAENQLFEHYHLTSAKSVMDLIKILEVPFSFCPTEISFLDYPEKINMGIGNHFELNCPTNLYCDPVVYNKGAVRCINVKGKKITGKIPPGQVYPGIEYDGIGVIRFTDAKGAVKGDTKYGSF